MGTDWGVEVFEEQGSLFVEMALPGVRLERVSVLAQGSQLVVSARRPEQDGVRRYRLRGPCIPREFARGLLLPPEARLDLATASYVQGLLRVRIPLEPEKPTPKRTIPVAGVPVKRRPRR